MLDKGLKCHRLNACSDIETLVGRKAWGMAKRTERLVISACSTLEVSSQRVGIGRTLWLWEEQQLA